MVSANMKTIGQTTLQGCENLTSINVHPDNKFFYASNGILYDLKKSKAIAAVGGIVTAKILDTVTDIGVYCFAYCAKLKTITFNSKLITCQAYSFLSCSSLKSVTFPATLKNIYNSAFNTCPKLTTVKFLGDALEKIQTYAFAGSKITSFEFSSKLISIDHEAFSGITTLKSIIFNPDCPLAKITYLCFYNTRINEVVIPKNVKNIEYRAFDNCININSITFANVSNIETIDYNAFTNCIITELNLPKSLKNLNQAAFFGCLNLSVLIFEEGMILSALGPSCFRNCVHLRTVQVPSSLKVIDPTTFIGCEELMEIIVPDDNPNYQSKYGVVYSKKGDRFVTCQGGLTSATISDSILVIGLNAFFGCVKLETIIFEPGCKLQIMEEGTFASCTALRIVELPTSLQTVQRGAFEGCTNLEKITFPDYALLI